jgi:hypothetical protein
VGLLVQLDIAPLVSERDSGWRGRSAGSTILGFSLSPSEAVDRLLAELTRAGYLHTAALRCLLCLSYRVWREDLGRRLGCGG